MELYQAEWCPHSHRVRQRLTELGVVVVLRQVPADPDEREDLDRFPERDDADRHRAIAREEVKEFVELRAA
jgi:glutaredoxin